MIWWVFLKLLLLLYYFYSYRYPYLKYINTVCNRYFYIIVNPFLFKKHLILTSYGNHLRAVIKKKKNFKLAGIQYNKKGRASVTPRVMFQIYI